MALNIWLGTTSGDYSVASNWSLAAVPVATNDVEIQGSVAITAGLNQSAIAINNFQVDPGYTGIIGSISGYLQINPTAGMDFGGTGKSFIDIGATAITPFIRNTATVTAAGTVGLYLKGSAMTGITIIKGVVGIAMLAGETSSVTTVNALWSTSQTNDVTLILGSGVTVTTVNQTGGTVEQRCASTTTKVQGGTLTTRGTGTIATMNVTGGTVYPNSTGTITTLNADGGTVDFTKSLAARTVTTVASIGNNATIIYDAAVVTFTNKIAPSGPVRVTIAPI